MSMLAGKNRLYILAAAVFIILLTLFTLDESIQPGRFTKIINTHPASESSAGNDSPPPVVDETSGKSTNAGSDADSKTDADPKTDAGPKTDADPKTDASSPAAPNTPAKGDTKTKDGQRISSLHYLIPASSENVHLCYNVVSSVAARYPVPVLLGWKGEGEYDAAKTHLAKLRAIQDYLHGVTEDNGENEDDLVLIVDGYDIIMQMPPDVMIERYFTIAAEADDRLAKQLNLSVEKAHEAGFRNTIFWGPDKICWPNGGNAARCWAAPVSNLGAKAFGPNSRNGDMNYNDPRWLNSGTVIGPLGDLSRYIDETMREISRTYDEKFENKESDQFYLANVWGRQEYYRTLEADKNKPKEEEKKDENKPKAKRDNRVLPEKTSEDQVTEYHIAIEYESALFQTKAGYEKFFGFLQFDQPGFLAKLNIDIFGEITNFVPSSVSMPANVYQTFAKLYEAIPESRRTGSSKTAAEWIKSLPLGVNFVTRHIYGLWHCTGGKDPIAKEYPKMWYYPWVRSLLRGAVAASRKHELISSVPIDGRLWAPSHYYPDAKGAGADEGQYGGAWSDYKDGQFVSWSALCGKDEEELLAGEQE